MKYKIQLILILLIGTGTIGFSQPIAVDQIVEVTGIILTKNTENRARPIPFATVSIDGTNRGTYANYQGMFSIVIKRGETINFNVVGYKKYSHTVPENYDKLYYSLVVNLEQEDINLDEVLVFPWPDRDNFRAEFLAMQPTIAMQMEDIAQDNLNRKRMLEMANAMQMDSEDNAALYLRQQTSNYAYMGQIKPMPVLNPLAWASFFKQIVERKKKKKKEKKQKIFEAE